MKTKLFKQEGVGSQTIDLNDYYLKLNGKVYHTNPLTLGMLTVEGEGGGALSYKNCHEIKLTNPNSNEWDVEVEMRRVKDETKIIGAVKGVKGSGNKITTYKSVPKLDENGCLILKLKSE